jgi:integrase
MDVAFSLWSETESRVVYLHGAGRSPKCLGCGKRTPLSKGRAGKRAAIVVVPADKIHPAYRALVFVGAYGGLRIGELAALRRSRVDFAAGKAQGGGPLRISNFRRKIWRPAVADANLAGLRIHDLRHTAVALWIAAGASPKEVAARAGHTSVSFVLDRYGHLFPEADKALRARLDLLFRGQVGLSP